jgi:hypothetical protein
VGDQAVWFLVSGGSEELPYHAVVNAQGRYEVVGSTLQPAGDDALSKQIAALGPEQLTNAVRSYRK